MVNERYDENEGHEESESEYHFSDDQVNYDMETDAAAKDTAAVVVAKESFADKLKNHRRIVVGVVIFIVLIGVVYKLVVPSSTTAPVTDFSQQATPTPTAPPTKITTTTSTTAPQPTAPVIAAPQPVVQQPAPPVVTTTTQTVNAPQTASAPSVVTTVTDSKNLMDRINTLEQQNTAMMNLLQTQYSQRMTDAETQNTQLRTQVQDLTSRVSNMEVAFRQLTKILRNARAAQASPQIVRAVASPRSMYTVQAIIPGRAWLKTEAGDTVTVAEGDVLRGFGRITKIDPYDGIVDIDTGNKIVTLSYGASGD